MGTWIGSVVTGACTIMAVLLTLWAGQRRERRTRYLTEQKSVAADYLTAYDIFRRGLRELEAHKSAASPDYRQQKDRVGIDGRALADVTTLMQLYFDQSVHDGATTASEELGKRYRKLLGQDEEPAEDVAKSARTRVLTSVKHQLHLETDHGSVRELWLHPWRLWHKR